MDSEERANLNMSMMPSIIPYGRQSISELDISEVIACLRSDWLTQGPRVEQFEKALCDITKSRYAVVVSNGTAALHLAMLALGVRPGDVGVVPTITFVASANAVAYAGGIVEFADVNPRTALIDISKLEEQCEKLAAAGTPPRVIVPVDMCGIPADLVAVKSIAKKYGAAIVEDAAHALGASYRIGDELYMAGSCSHSDAAILSFHPVKHITTAEGGAITTNDEGVAKRLRELRSHGIHRVPELLERKNEGPWYYEQTHLGYNYRLSDLQCALGITQASRLPKFLENRRKIATYYDSLFAQQLMREYFLPLERPCNTNSAFHLYVIRIRPDNRSHQQVRAMRLHLYQFLRTQSIYTQVHYIPVHWQPFYRKLGVDTEAMYLGAQEYYNGCLSLPVYPDLSDEDLERVNTALHHWCEKFGPTF